MRVLISHTHRLVYVSNPKAASTTIHRIFLELSAINPSTSTRRAFRSSGLKETMKGAGLSQATLNRRGEKKYRKKYKNYYWFTFVRDPYSRVISNYNNKLNRYARRFDRRLFLVGKIGQLFSGFEAWKSHLSAVKYMQKALPFEKFVEGLYRNGISFDAHFRLQKRTIRVKRMSFDYVGKVEKFEEDIKHVLASTGVKDPRVIALAERTRENATNSTAPPDQYLTPHARQMIYELYGPDFDAFGYPSLLAEGEARERPKPKRRKRRNSA